MQTPVGSITPPPEEDIFIISSEPSSSLSVTTSSSPVLLPPHFSASPEASPDSQLEIFTSRLFANQQSGRMSIPSSSPSPPPPFSATTPSDNLTECPAASASAETAAAEEEELEEENYERDEGGKGLGEHELSEISVSSFASGVAVLGSNSSPSSDHPVHFIHPLSQSAVRLPPTSHPHHHHHQQYNSMAVSTANNSPINQHCGSPPTGPEDSCKRSGSLEQPHHHHLISSPRQNEQSHISLIVASSSSSSSSFSLSFTPAEDLLLHSFCTRRNNEFQADDEIVEFASSSSYSVSGAFSSFYPSSSSSSSSSSSVPFQDNSASSDYTAAAATDEICVDDEDSRFSKLSKGHHHRHRHHNLLDGENDDELEEIANEESDTAETDSEGSGSNSLIKVKARVKSKSYSMINGCGRMESGGAERSEISGCSSSMSSSSSSSREGDGGVIYGSLELCGSLSSCSSSSMTITTPSSGGANACSARRLRSSRSSSGTCDEVVGVGGFGMCVANSSSSGTSSSSRSDDDNSNIFMITNGNHANRTTSLNPNMIESQHCGYNHTLLGINTNTSPMTTIRPAWSVEVAATSSSSSSSSTGSSSLSLSYPSSSSNSTASGEATEAIGGVVEMGGGVGGSASSISCLSFPVGCSRASGEGGGVPLTPDHSPGEGVPLGMLKELTCPICLEIFYLPVTMACGHTFCRYCISHNKLAGKNCPLCRQLLGSALSVNTVLSNLIKAVGLKRKTSLTINVLPETVNTVDDKWWSENFIKVFFDDLTACVIDFFTKHNKWTKAKWVFNLEDCEFISRLVGFDKDDRDGSSERLHYWVERYVAEFPSVCPPRELSRVTLKIFHDRIHRIEGQTFDSLRIQNRLPWDAGRHAKSLIHMPHSSVSLSHLLYVRCPDGQLGVVDCGSTIGTMIKVNNYYALKGGDIIHIGDRLEVEVYLTNTAFGSPYRGFMWSSTCNEVLDYSQGTSSASPSGSTSNSGAEDEISSARSGASLEFSRETARPSSSSSWASASSSSIAAAAAAALGASECEGSGGSCGEDGVVMVVVDNKESEEAARSRASSGGFSVDGGGNGSRSGSSSSTLLPSCSSRGIGEGEGENIHHLVNFADEASGRNSNNSETKGPTTQGGGALTPNPSGQTIKAATAAPTILENSENQPTLPPDCVRLESHLRIKIQSGGQPDRDEWVDPKGIVLGRGPHAQSSYKKVSVTASNGYVSREHCLIYYDGSKPPGQRWLLRDISTLGTFLRVKPFSDPIPLPVGSIFKAGQCKVEVGPYDGLQCLAIPRRTPSPPNPAVAAAAAYIGLPSGASATVGPSATSPHLDATTTAAALSSASLDNTGVGVPQFFEAAHQFATRRGMSDPAVVSQSVLNSLGHHPNALLAAHAIAAASMMRARFPPPSPPPLNNNNSSAVSSFQHQQQHHAHQAAVAVAALRQQLRPTPPPPPPVGGIGGGAGLDSTTSTAAGVPNATTLQQQQQIAEIQQHYRQTGILQQQSQQRVGGGMDEHGDERLITLSGRGGDTEDLRRNEVTGERTQRTEIADEMITLQRRRDAAGGGGALQESIERRNEIRHDHGFDSPSQLSVALNNAVAAAAVEAALVSEESSASATASMMTVLSSSSSPTPSLLSQHITRSNSSLQTFGNGSGEGNSVLSSYADQVDPNIISELDDGRSLLSGNIIDQRLLQQQRIIESLDMTEDASFLENEEARDDREEETRTRHGEEEEGQRSRATSS